MRCRDRREIRQLRWMVDLVVPVVLFVELLRGVGEPKVDQVEECVCKQRERDVVKLKLDISSAIRLGPTFHMSRPSLTHRRYFLYPSTRSDGSMNAVWLAPGLPASSSAFCASSRAVNCSIIYLDCAMNSGVILSDIVDTDTVVACGMLRLTMLSSGIGGGARNTASRVALAPADRAASEASSSPSASFSSPPRVWSSVCSACNALSKPCCWRYSITACGRIWASARDALAPAPAAGAGESDMAVDTWMDPGNGF